MRANKAATSREFVLSLYISEAELDELAKEWDALGRPNARPATIAQLVNTVLESTKDWRQIRSHL